MHHGAEGPFLEPAKHHDRLQAQAWHLLPGMQHFFTKRSHVMGVFLRDDLSHAFGAVEGDG